MTYKLPILVLFLFFFSIINAQTSVEQKKVDSVNSIEYYYIVSNLAIARSVFKKNVELAQKINYTEGLAISNSKLALAYYLSGKFEESANCHLEAIRGFEQLNKYPELAHEYAEFGFSLKRRDLEKANLYMQRALQVIKEHGLEKESTSIPTYNNYGTVKLIGNELDSAEYYFNYVLKEELKAKNTIGIPYAYNNLADLNIQRKEYKKAHHYLNLSDQYRNKEIGEFGRIENTVLLAYLFKAENKVDSSIYYCKIALEKAKKTGYNYVVKECLELLIDLSQLKNNYPGAFAYSMQLMEYKDSVLTLETSQRLQELQVEFDTEQQEKELSQKAVEITKAKLKITWLIISIVLVFAIMAWVFRFQNQRRKHQKMEYLLEKERETTRTNKEMYDEKVRISRELHDNIGSQLTFMISSLENYDNIGDKSIKPKLKGMVEFGKSTMTDLRDTIWAMKTEAGTVQQLFEKILDVKSKLDISTVIEVKLIGNENFELNPTEMLNAYRIIQEGIQNCIKYSQAKQLKITFESNDVLQIRIQDDGIGFNMEETTTGNGLHNMKNRAKEIGAILIITSENQKGTLIELTISKEK